MLCKICNIEIKNMGFAYHIHHKHNISAKEYYDTYLKQPSDGLCATCGKPVEFLSVFLGYKKYCCRTCCDKNEERRKQLSNTVKSEECQQKIRKTKLERYGSETYNNPEKSKETFLKKYGVINNWQIPEIREKALKNAAKTNNARKKQKEVKTYSKSNLMFNEKISETKQTLKKTFEVDNDCTHAGYLKQIYGQGWYKSNIIDEYLFDNNGYAYVRNKDIPKIEEYVIQHELSTSSKEEKELLDFVKSIYTGNILENSRNIISPYELDIYIPDKKLAIEFNGTYYHSINNGLDKNYHLMKTKMCEKKGIRLIHIFEYEWINKQNICKSLIQSALGKAEIKIYARNCVVKEVSKKEAETFLTNNHLQDSTVSGYRLGLYYNNELVQLITLGKSRFKKDEIELIRMCTKLNTQVIGGFSKLIKHQPYDSIVSYVDRSKFTGDGYIKVGFNKIGETDPSYHYYKNGMLLNRVSAQKHKLKSLLGDKFDETKTEIQNMIDNRYWMIYDCGNLKMRYER